MPTGIPYASDYFSAQSTPAAQHTEPFTVTIYLSSINIDREGLNGITKTSFSSRHNTILIHRESKQMNSNELLSTLFLKISLLFQELFLSLLRVFNSNDRTWE